MKIISTYILKRVFLYALGITVSCTALGFLIEILSHLTLLEKATEGLGTVLAFLCLFLPEVLIVIFPFALAIAIAHAFSLFHEDGELIAFYEARLSPTQLCRPILCLTLLFTLLCGYANTVFLPYAHAKTRSMAAAMQANFLSNFLQTEIFSKLAENVFIKIKNKAPDGGFEDLFIADERNPKFNLYYYAKKAALEKADTTPFLHMKNGQVEQFNKQNETATLLSFDAYTIDLASLVPSNTGLNLSPKDMSFTALRAVSSKDKVYTICRAELHRRFAQALLPLSFALIALAFSVTVRSRRLPSLAFWCLVPCLALYWLSTLCFEKAQRSLSYIPFLYLLPIGAMLLALWRLYADTLKGADRSSLLASKMQSYSRLERSL